MMLLWLCNKVLKPHEGIFVNGRTSCAVAGGSINELARMKAIYILLILSILTGCKTKAFVNPCVEQGLELSLHDIESRFDVNYLNRSSLSGDKLDSYIYSFGNRDTKVYLVFVSPNLCSEDSMLFTNRVDTLGFDSDGSIMTVENPILYYANDSILTDLNICFKLSDSEELFISCIKVEGECLDILTREKYSENTGLHEMIDAYLLTNNGFNQVSINGLVRVGEECYYRDGGSPF